jgi:hypothetical protein
MLTFNIKQMPDVCQSASLPQCPAYIGRVQWQQWMPAKNNEVPDIRIILASNGNEYSGHIFITVGCKSSRWFSQQDDSWAPEPFGIQTLLSAMPFHSYENELTSRWFRKQGRAEETITGSVVHDRNSPVSFSHECPLSFKDVTMSVGSLSLQVDHMDM